ncbi:hypothetical protein AMS68_002555 [Peltaster fructicola]|uniref:Meiotic recombination protein DMC1 n=1 Tax=Peltaster fructicola TaxID=286661 RepID=A0A6H0XQX2_9PEZI|nr:hypothetical protein AMS68_002555 [Peltaster fructicola]
MATPYQQAGGFILSPPLSVSSSQAHASLPRPRDSPLRPGGSKESTFIRYVDQQILHVQRRFAKRTTPDAKGVPVEKDAAAVWDNIQGYTSMREVCKELEELVGTVWISGTPSLQVPYLINIASLLNTVIPAMPTTPKQLFRLLDKLDHAFASLLQGRDVDSGEALPGFNTGRGVSGTEKVRLRSVVERSRRCVFEALKSDDLDLEYEEDDDVMDVDSSAASVSGELVLEGDENAGDEPDWEMQIARVYDRTIVELGDSLETPNIGIITE